MRRLKRDGCCGNSTRRRRGNDYQVIVLGQSVSIKEFRRSVAVVVLGFVAFIAFEIAWPFIEEAILSCM